MKSISLADLCTVAHDRDASTRTHTVYRVASSRISDLRYKVVHNDDIDTWTCNGLYCGEGDDCRHRRLARLMHLARRWESRLDTHTVAMLRDVQRDKRGLIRVGLDIEDSTACLIAVDALLLALGETLEEAA